MFNVIIIDDEIWALQGIKKTFDWEMYGFEVVGEYSNPQIAIEAICQNPPDVIFTDIRMPVISGLQLIETVKQKFPDIEFIIISGYADFEYARIALQNGTFDYLLKPINKSVGEQLLLKLSARLSKKVPGSVQEQINKAYESWIASSKGHIPNQKLLTVFGHIDGVRNARQLDIVSKAPEIIPLWSEYALLIINENDLKDLNELLFKPELFYGLSAIDGGKEANAFWQAYIAYITACFGQKSALCYYNALNLHTVKKITSRIKSTISIKDTVRISNSFDNGLNEFQKERLSIEDLLYLYNEIIAYTQTQFYETTYESALPFMNLQQMIDNYATFEAVFSDLKNCCINAVNSDNSEDGAYQANQDFQSLLEHVEEHVYESLQLKELAAQYGMNYSYVCVLFKRVKGCTFTEYVTSIRMEKSLLLLKNMDMPIYEIAEKSGFPDHFYFSKSFKKRFGITPTEYRRNLE